MKYELHYEGYEQYLFDVQNPDIFGKAMYKFKFDNGWGAFVTVVTKTRFRTLWSLISLKFRDEDYYICYDNPVCNEVVMYLTDDDVRNLLEQIKGL